MSWRRQFFACVAGTTILVFLLLKEGIDFHRDLSIVRKEENRFGSRLKGPLLAEDPKLVSHVKRNVLKAPSSLPRNLTGLTAQSEVPYFDLQRHMFTKFARKTFSDKPPGFFVEAGALDGETSSNSLWLEVERNWTGLLVEPFHTNCRPMWQKHRNAWTACSCLTPRNYAETTVLEIPHENTPPSSELTWLYHANVRTFDSRVRTMKDFIHDTALFTYQESQCFPLLTFLKALNVSVVDLLSLDTQGGEKDMVLSLPLDRILIRYMFVEYYKPGPHPKHMDESFVDEMAKINFTLKQFNIATGEYIFASMN